MQRRTVRDVGIGQAHLHQVPLLGHDRRARRLSVQSEAGHPPTVVEQDQFLRCGQVHHEIGLGMWVGCEVGHANGSRLVLTVVQT